MEGIKLVEYKDESYLPEIQRLVAKDLSEPYSVFTYRYFLHKWPQLCMCAFDESTEDDDGEGTQSGNVGGDEGGGSGERKEIEVGTSSAADSGEVVVADAGDRKGKGKMIGTIICKAEFEHNAFRGYIGMLTVSESYRKRGIGLKLAQIGIDKMVAEGCTEIVLETEMSNKGALNLYGRLGFSREERLPKYYLNGGDAYRLRLDIATGK
jgi:peptide alpha-N-acetyltransferase